jgi:tetratricopeptide (TPR) repeat protein
MKNVPGIFVIAVLTLIGAGSAAAGSYGTELPFTAGTGGRASGMGLAATSVIGEPSLQHFNPACLAGMQYVSFEFYRTTFFDSKSMYHSLSYSHPMMNYGTLGITVLRLDVGGIEERDIYNILLTDDLKNSQTRVLLGYATSLQSFLSAGVNLKIDNQSFGDFSGSGIGVDLGFLATKSFADPWVFETVRGGLAIQNLIEPSVKLDQEDVADPMNIAFGLSAVATTGNLGFVSSLDLVSPRFSPFRERLGQEFSYLETFHFRVGLDGTTPTVGLGAAYKNVALNYAFRDEELGSNHRISVSIHFGSSLDEKRARARVRLENELDRQITSKMSAFESSQVSKTMRRADSLYTLEQYPAAQEQYELALLWDSDNERARSRIAACRYHDEFQQGRASMVSGDYLQALYHLKQALRQSPDDPAATALVQECNQRLDADQDHSEMINRMVKHAIDLYASRRFVDALAGFREILKLDRDNALAAEYEQKTVINIKNLKQALIVEANDLAGRGELGNAISTLENARRYDPDDTWITARIDALRRELRNRAAATPAKKPPQPPARTEVRQPLDHAALEPKYQEGLRYFEKGDFDLAVKRLAEVWAVAPDFHNVTELLTKTHLFTGMRDYSEGKYEKAIRAWEMALTVDPGNLKAKRYLRKVREETNRLGRVNDG